MRNRKSILVLLLACLAMVVANIAVYRDDLVGKAPSRAVLVDYRDDVSQVEIEQKGNPPIRLEKRDRYWNLTAPYAGRADERVVMKLLDGLMTKRIQEVQSDAELLKLGRIRADFSLEDPLLQVTIFTGDRRNVVAFGTRTPSSDGVYASVSGFDGVFIVPVAVLEAVNVPADGFRLRSLFLPDVDVGHLSAFDIKQSAGSNLTFARTADEWNVSGGLASTKKVDKFLSDLISAEAVEFVWPVGASNETEHVAVSLLAGYGLDTESAIVVTLKGSGARDNQISFGKEASGGLVFALVQNGAAIVTVPSALKDAAGQSAVMFTDSRLFPLEARAVSLFSISSEGVLYALSKDASGLWNIESPISAPADRENVESVLNRVLLLSSADVVTSGGLEVSISTNAAKMTVSRESVLGGLAFEDLRSREMLRIDPALVKRIVRTPGSTGAKSDSVVYSRDRRIWTVEAGGEGGTVDEKGIASVLSVIGSLAAVRVDKLRVQASSLADYGLDVPFLMVSVDQNSDDSVRRNILIGKKTRGGRFATIGSSDAVFVVSDAHVKELSAAIIKK